MKTYLTSELSTPGVGAPMKQGTMVFLQQAYTELLVATAQSLVVNFSATGSSYSSTVPYVIYGCQITGSTTFNITAGLILYNGVLYISNAASGISPGFPVPGGHTYAGTITTTYYTDPSADPVTLNNGVTTANLHQIQSINWTYATSGSGTFNYTQLTYNLPIGTIIGSGPYNNLVTLTSEVNTLNTEVGTLTTEVNTINTELTITGWTNITPSTGWVTTGNAFGYIKDGRNQISLRGIVTNNSSSPTGSAGIYPIFQMPSGTFPSNTKRFPVTLFDNGGSPSTLNNTFLAAWVEVNTVGNGSLIFNPGITITNTNWYIYCDSITYNTL